MSRGLYHREMPLIARSDVDLGFRGPLVLDQANLTLEPGERVCLLGAGGGKTTLLRLLQGVLEPDRGAVVRQQGLRTAMLPQEVPRDLRGSVFEEVARGLGPTAELLAEYHRLAGRLASEGSDALHAELGRVQHALETDGGWRMHQEVGAVLSRMGLDPDADVATLSAGMKRRVLLAKAVVGGPDLLLLDEPTNHLDIDAIRWLEDFLLRSSGRCCSSPTTALAPHSGDADPRTRPRPADELVVRLRDVSGPQTGGPGSQSRRTPS